MKFLLPIAFLLIFIGCGEHRNLQEKDFCFIDMSVVNDDIAFPHYPVSVCKMTQSTPFIWGLSFFGEDNKCKHFSYHNSLHSRVFSYNEDTIFPWRRYYDSSHPQTGLALIVDNSQSYGVPANSYYLQNNLPIDEDYYQTMKGKFAEKYPPISTKAFYIVNRQTYGIPIFMSMYIPLMIQEALHPSGKWMPIEHIGILGCGNSGHAIKIPPNSYLTGSVLEYAGNYETQLRLKLKIGEHILYSTPYKGSINFEQFEIREEYKVLMEKDTYGSGIFESLFLHQRRVCKEYW